MARPSSFPTPARRSSATHRACTSSAYARERGGRARPGLGPCSGWPARSCRSAATAIPQGLEMAVENGQVNDPDSARRWLEDQLLLNLARFERRRCCSRIAKRRHRTTGCACCIWPPNTAPAAKPGELQLESRQMGYSSRSCSTARRNSTSRGVTAWPRPTSPACPGLGAGRPCLADRTCRCTGRLAVGLAGKSAGGADEDPAAGAAGGAAADLAAVAGPEPGAAGSESAAGSGLGQRAVWIGADQHGA